MPSWVQIDPNTTQDIHPIVSNGLFFIYVNTTGSFVFVGVAQSRNTDGTATYLGHAFWDVNWLPGEQRRVRLRYVAADAGVYLDISDAVGGGDRNQRDDAALAYESSSLQSVVDTWGVGDVVLGAAGTNSLHGWMDDVSFYSY